MYIPHLSLCIHDSLLACLIYCCQRGNVELLELTNLRTRLQMFLDISISARETEALFKKFDPNQMGSVNIGQFSLSYVTLVGVLYCMCVF